mmetsp:Transcript_23935/g.77833  ORF Transcript_23935/g.77833 Transcript_23935/m.77833 type:complete len:448 (+) Transcript_23935:143-1486(+)
MIHQAKREAIGQEITWIMKLKTQHETSISEMDSYHRARENESIDRIEEQRKILSEIMEKENDKWSKTIKSIRTLFALAVSRITSVYESVNKDRSRTVFLRCWALMRKPVFRIRLRKIMNRAYLRRLVLRCSEFMSLEKSIHKYRPLKLKHRSFVCWLQALEIQFNYTTFGLKNKVLRRQVLAFRLSNAMNNWNDGNKELAIPTTAEFFRSKKFVLLSWIETHQERYARNKALALCRVKREMRTKARCFDFMKKRVIWRQRANKESVDCFIYKNAYFNLLLWKKYFFSGVRHTTTLRRAEVRRWKVTRWTANASTLLFHCVEERRSLVSSRLRKEQTLLLNVIGRGDASDQAFLHVPPALMGTFFNLRRMQVEKALKSADGLIQVAKRQLGSSLVGFRVSSWFFEARCIHLPMATSTRLPATSSYWRNIRSLNALAQQKGSDYKVKAM